MENIVVVNDAKTDEVAALHLKVSTLESKLRVAEDANLSLQTLLEETETKLQVDSPHQGNSSSFLSGIRKLPLIWSHSRRGKSVSASSVSADCCGWSDVPELFHVCRGPNRPQLGRMQYTNHWQRVFSVVHPVANIISWPRVDENCLSAHFLIGGLYFGRQVIHKRVNIDLLTLNFSFFLGTQTTASNIPW
jgi:hypothetical protein